jgi:hypothetical protein
MKIPHCGGLGPHRHDFEEMFHLLDGEIEFTFRGEKQVVKAGVTVNIPANAPHFCTNIEGQRARMLCMCAPGGRKTFSWPLARRSTADHSCAQAQQGRAGGVHEEGRSARAQIPLRASQTLTLVAQVNQACRQQEYCRPSRQSNGGVPSISLAFVVSALF